LLSDPPRDATISAEPPSPPIAAPIRPPFQIESRPSARLAVGACRTAAASRTSGVSRLAENGPDAGNGRSPAS
jgi:hypothetical protein